jgi:hypothetical protein
MSQKAQRPSHRVLASNKILRDLVERGEKMTANLRGQIFLFWTRRTLENMALTRIITMKMLQFLLPTRTLMFVLLHFLHEHRVTASSNYFKNLKPFFCKKEKDLMTSCLGFGRHCPRDKGSGNRWLRGWKRLIYPNFFLNSYQICVRWTWFWYGLALWSH